MTSKYNYTYCISSTIARSVKTSPAKKCCCLYSVDSSAKHALSRAWLVEDAWDGVGEAGAELQVNGVPKAKLRATKCSCEHNILIKSNCQNKLTIN